MSERSERLLECIGDIREETVEQADNSPSKGSGWRRWGAMAAALILVVGIGGYVLPRMGMGGSAGGSGVNPEAEGASTFMYYAGPIFPLALREENVSVRAERDITLDFAPWVPTWQSNEDVAAGRDWLTPAEQQEVLEQYNEWYPEGGRYVTSDDINVTDAYVLTNSSGEAQRISVLYPFAGSLSQMKELAPTLYVDGKEVETTLRVGDYVGGFEGAYGGDLLTPTEEGSSVNLDIPDNWEDYRDALELPAYLEKALGEWPDLSGVPVIVYKFTDPWGEKEDSKAGIPNPSIRVTFNMDYDKTRIMTYGFHSGLYDAENGVRGCGFSIRQPHQPGYGDPYYIIVAGEDVENLTYSGHVTGGWDDDPAIEVGVTITRYETDLDSVLLEIMEIFVPSLVDGRDREARAGFDFDLWYGAFCDYLMTYGALSDSGVDRYDDGMLESTDSESVDRVLYLEAEVTVPADGAVTLRAEMIKKASYDYYCTHSENRGVSGYDLVTKLGSNLNCTEQRAVLLDHGQIDIVRQNFGFDPAAGGTSVALDPEQEHYYLEVKRISGR